MRIFVTFCYTCNGIFGITMTFKESGGPLRNDYLHGQDGVHPAAQDAVAAYQTRCHAGHTAMLAVASSIFNSVRCPMAADGLVGQAVYILII